MDWHPVISVQQQTPDNDFCHFSISNVRFAFWAFFWKPEKLGSHTGSKWWPGDPDVKDDPLTRWPNDPVPSLTAMCTDAAHCYRSVHLSVCRLGQYVCLSVCRPAYWSQPQAPQTDRTDWDAFRMLTRVGPRNYSVGWGSGYHSCWKG